MKILDFLKFCQRCLGRFRLIEKWLLLVQFDVWKCLGLSVVDLGQLITLEASPENTSEKLKKVYLGHAYRLGSLGPVWGRPGWIWLIEKWFVLVYFDV